LLEPIKNICQIPEIQSFRRALVFGTGFSLLLISIVSAKNMWEYYISAEFLNIYDILLLIFSAWGIYYVVFLWFSFLLMGFKELRGCAWAAIPKVILNREIHICIDSVLNGRQDIVQKDYGISVELELLGANGGRCRGRFGDQDLDPGRRNGRPGGLDYHRSRRFRDLRHADSDEPVGGGRPRAGDQRREVPDDGVDGEGPQITAEGVGVGGGARREQL
jgi:hypothetical protein